MSKSLLYRVEQTVTTRKPADLSKCDIFECEGVVTAGTRSFARQIVTDTHELNLLRNDLCFLFQDIFGDLDKDLVARNTRLSDITTFYVWVCLPYTSKEAQNPGAISTLSPVQSSVFPFDLYHHHHRLSLSQIEEIQSILKQDINAYIYIRKHGAIPQIPYPLRGLTVRS